MYLRIILKVCEACGALWYRTENCNGVYCRTCAPRMRVLPPRRRSCPARRRPRHRGGNPVPRGGAA